MLDAQCLVMAVFYNFFVDSVNLTCKLVGLSIYLIGHFIFS